VARVGLVREQIDYYNRRATEYDATSTPEGGCARVAGRNAREDALCVRPLGCGWVLTSAVY
jgi:hypothetical protein